MMQLQITYILVVAVLATAIVMLIGPPIFDYLLRFM